MKWWLIAWREIRWEVFLDRTSLLRTGVFVVIPLFFVVSNRGLPQGPAGDVNPIRIPLHSALLPALSLGQHDPAPFPPPNANRPPGPLVAGPPPDVRTALPKTVGIVG